MSSYKTVEEAETRIAELEEIERNLTRESINHKKGYKQLKDFIEGKGLDVTKDLEEQWEGTIGKTKTEAEKNSKQTEKMQAQINDLMGKLEKSESEKTESKIRAELTGKFSDVIGGEDIVDNWILKKLVKIEDGKIYKVEDGKDVPIETSIGAYKKNNPQRIIVNQSNGGGSHSVTEKDAQKTEKMNMKDFRKLTETAKKDYLDKGNEIIPD
jgi:hypothetical protein